LFVIFGFSNVGTVRIVLNFNRQFSPSSPPPSLLVLLVRNTYKILSIKPEGGLVCVGVAIDF
jgi:hypothetical protein